MLSNLLINNFAIVDSLEIQFQSGMSVITGETGAGKSIILGALGLTLGDRADTSVVRTGAGKAEICAEFRTDGNTEVQQWLLKHELAGDPKDCSCLLRRTVSDDGRSRAYINGIPVTLASLGELGEMLMDIHSQHEHQSLLKKATHVKLLDEFGVDRALLERLQNCFKQWQNTHQKIETLTAQSREQGAQQELIRYQADELRELNPGKGEYEALESEYLQLSSADATRLSLQQVLSLCRDDDGSNVGQELSRAISLLDNLPYRTPGLQSILDLLNGALIQVDEAAADLRTQLDSVEQNPVRLEEVNQRLADLHRVARKHRVSPTGLFALHEQLVTQLTQFDTKGQLLEQLAVEVQALQQEHEELAKQVSRQRQIAARKLAKLINVQLQSLGMSEAVFEVQLSPDSGDKPSAGGRETVEFLVATNPGQASKPLSKIASGGELSRISLAIQVITARTSRTPALVFDEVDVGIGGGVARQVGRLLRQLAEHAQIICVTHQAQVAAQGQHHLVVSKQVSGQSARTTITALDHSQRIKEIARMLGGEHYSEESLAHAGQMVSQS